MKRSAALVELSRQHHTALVLALRIEKAGDPQFLSLIAQSLPAVFADELEPHFLAEEQTLLPQLLMAGESALVLLTLEEHRHLRQLADRIGSGELAALPEFGSLLAAHVRFEERELFAVAQEKLGALSLAASGHDVRLEKLCELELSDEDILDALAHISGYIDISTEDFRAIYHLAWHHAVDRMQPRTKKSQP